MNSRRCIRCVASACLVALLAAFTAYALADETASPKEVIAKVREAAELLGTLGESGIPQIQDPNGRFRWKDSYVFVVDCASDRVMANSAFPARVGGDIKQHLDYAGKPYGAELCRASKQQPSGVWVEYVWPRGGRLVPERKVSFVVDVSNREFQVGAGIYGAQYRKAELAQFID